MRRRAVDPLLLALGAVLGLLVVDVVLGATLQLNTVFGYSPTVAGRFAGLGNLAFAQLAGSALLLAGVVAGRIARAPGRAARASASSSWPSWPTGRPSGGPTWAAR